MVPVEGWWIPVPRLIPFPFPFPVDLRTRREGKGMGKGKGTPELWVVRVKPGRILFEVDGIPQDVAREALGLAAAKLPVKTRFIERIAE